MIRKRSIAFILCFTMLFSMVVQTIPNASASEKSVDILRNGEKVSQVTIEQTEKETLSAAINGFDAVSYQWQLLLDSENSVWVDIYDKTERECEVSYAVVKNLLDNANSAYIRCVAKSDEESYYSDAVCVSILLDEEESSNITSFAKAEFKAIPEANREAAPLSLERANSDAHEYVTITIKYLDVSSLTGPEAAIYSPYVATIEKGSDFKQNVVSPTFLGFAPFYDNDASDDDFTIDDDASMIPLDLKNVTENLEIKVYYKPIKVDFAIRYFFQNINDDHYTENVSLYHTSKAETGTIISDDYLRAQAGDTTGYEIMYHIPESVAADGSTVFECYYDRNYYLIQFDLDGGYGVEPIYARFGTPFVIHSPIKHGFQFIGWDKLVDTDGDGIEDTGDGKADKLPNTIPSEKQVYKALWQTVDTTYTVVYWKENAENNGYSYWGSAEKQSVSSRLVDGSDTAAEDDMPDARYFTFNSALSDKDVLIEGDGTSIVNVYYTRKYYKITFKAPGLCTIPEGHKHDDSCYDTVCHIHNESCERTLTCTIAEHKSHTENCLDCTLPVHEAHTPDCCTTDEHEHTTSCWNNVGSRVSKPSGAPPSPVDGQIYRRYANKKYTYYIFIKNNWYNYSSTANNNAVIPTVCGKAEHEHGDGSCSCSTAIHTHGEKCYKDPLHSHTNECYTYLCEAGNHVHTSACKRLICSVAENHSHTKDCKDEKKTNVVKTVYRKYQQSLEDLWPVTDDNGKTYGDGQRWSPTDSSYYTQVLVFLSAMPPDDFTLSLSTSSASTKTMNYYLQVLPGQEYDKHYDGHYYELDRTIKANYNFITKAEDFFDIKGFEQYDSDPRFSGTQINSSTANFYYNRITDHYLQFDNNGIQLKDKEVYGIMYGANIKQYNFVPEYPDNLEPNAYTFTGWYTSAGCYAGTEVNWDTITMPEGNLLLYAKWTPNTHEVNIFTTYEDMLAFENGDTSVQTHARYPAVTHGTTIGSVHNPVHKDDGKVDMIFAGWFYMENGQKKAFAPLDMPINRDMNIFADWSSKQPQPYRIEYVLYSDPSVKVAEDTTGFAYGGSTRTFVAKAGNPYNQLFEEYNDGYFPTVGSHSITMQYEEDKENPVLNVYTFYYVAANDIEYTVRYVNKETNTLIEEATVKYTSSAAVTERFKAFENMVPDAFYKRLVISVEWDDEKKTYVGTEDNVITFYYTPNTSSAYYAVHYMLEKQHDPSLTDAEIAQLQKQYYIDGTGGYEETGTHVEGVGDIGSTVSINPQAFAGFELIDNDKVAISVVNGKQSVSKYIDKHYEINITAEGTELYIFYKRLEFNYTVHYYLYNTVTPVSDKFPSVTGKAPYGSSVSRNAAAIPGYTCVSAQTSQTIPIRDKEEQNVIIFYYAPVQYVAEYVPVPSNGGWLSNTIEVISGNETLSGSVPTAHPYYVFNGWFLDEACTQSAADYGTIDQTTGQFIPNKDRLSETERNIFYAKFSAAAGNFTIDRTDAEDDNQVFVYEVKNNDTGETIFVTVVGNTSVTIYDLPFGEYTVTQQNNWSWRYSDSAMVVSHQGVGGTTVVFRKAADTEQWLNGNSDLVKNQRRGDD